MSRVDFYVLAQAGSDAQLRFACRLAEKAVERGHRIYMQTASAAESQRLDELLWTFSDRSFLPHEIVTGSAASDPQVKILLGHAPPPDGCCELLINLSDALPESPGRYERIAEVVAADPERKRLARERYKQYRELGCTLESHNV
ncbi:MAG: DNA polymerase III subunit chi [Proteobacteria bacterium]|nr:MAG: DNA polymerase III subunit chi [Pseudomonadota bacterium]